MSSIDDVSYFYLDLLESLDLRDTLVVGVGIGAWIAAEIAVKSTERLSHLVMANPVGIKVGDRETRDIVDIWSMSQAEVDALAYFDPAVGKRDYKNLPDADSLAAARNREATARFCWSPYMHNPKLKARLHRIGIPTLFLWGTADRILTEAYGRAYCAEIPGARFETIERAGHYPHLEQPEEFARRALAFAEAPAQRKAAARA
jgi:pimeloyl-ACP methyl ester carboxylesterase